jgi:hypothetical protein
MHPELLSGWVDTLIELEPVTVTAGFLKSYPQPPELVDN